MKNCINITYSNIWIRTKEFRGSCCSVISATFRH